MAAEPRAQARAHAMVAKAVAMGVLPRIGTLTCFDCHGTAAAYHHYLGYAVEHQLDVVPLCDGCHVRRHLPARKRRGPRHQPGTRKPALTQLPVALHQTMAAIAAEQHLSLSALLRIACAYYAEHWPAERLRDFLEGRPYYADQLDEQEDEVTAIDRFTDYFAPR